MMIVMKETATEEEVDAVIAKIERAGARAHRSSGARVTVIMESGARIAASRSGSAQLKVLKKLA